MLALLCLRKEVTMIKSVKLENFLSFGSHQDTIDLRPLNIIIGTNGCGKSNFLEAFDLLRNAAGDIKKPIREGGGVLDWLHKGLSPHAICDAPIVGLEFEISTNALSLKLQEKNDLRYLLSFTSTASRFEIVDEHLSSASIGIDTNQPVLYFKSSNGTLQVSEGNNTETSLKTHWDNFNDKSALSEINDMKNHPEITSLSKAFSKICLYRDWTFGRNSPCRQPQKVDMPFQYLEPDCSNLALVLNQMNHDIPSKKRLLKELQNFYPDVEDYFVNTIGNYVQIYFQERGLDKPIPASRLSDGTLRYLCLLAILCNPTLPPLICIEEPELGLHPDVIPGLAKLMTEASERCQLIVTTHSDILVESFTDNPEAILVAEKTEVGTQINRLQKEQLAPWLEKYRLGALWTSGDIGGTRW